MRDSIDLLISNPTERYEITLKRTITYIIGDSGSGKTRVIDIIRRWQRRRPDVEVNCKVGITIVSTFDDIDSMDTSKDRVYILDEDICIAMSNWKNDLEANKYRKLLSSKISGKIDGKYANSYFLVITREPFLDVNTSISEIYRINKEEKESITYKSLKCVYEDEVKRCN